MVLEIHVCPFLGTETRVATASAEEFVFMYRRGLEPFKDWAGFLGEWLQQCPTFPSHCHLQSELTFLPF